MVTWLENTEHIYNIKCLFQAQSAAAEIHASAELSIRIVSLEQEVAQHKEDAGKAQSEVERLLEILKETENEKNDKEKKIHELERWEARMERWCGLIEKYKSELIIPSPLRLNYLLLCNPSFRTNPLVLYLFPPFLLPFWLHHHLIDICVWTITHVSVW